MLVMHSESSILLSILEKWFPLISERAHSLYSVIQLIHLLFLVVLDERTISGADLTEMNFKGCMVASVHTTVTFQALIDLKMGWCA